MSANSLVCFSHWAIFCVFFDSNGFLNINGYSQWTVLTAVQRHLFDGTEVETGQRQEVIVLLLLGVNI